MIVACCRGLIYLYLIHWDMLENMLNGSMSFLLIVQYSLLLFPVSSSFNQKQTPANHQNDAANNSQSKRPANVVMFPIGHPVTTITPGSKYNNCYDTTHTSQSENATIYPQQQLILLMMTRAARVQNSQKTSNQQQSHTQCEEELSGHKEVRQKYIMYDIVFFFEYPPTTIEPGVIQMMWVLETLETYLPQTCKDQTWLFNWLSVLVSIFFKHTNTY